jgi:hypothetical protein
MKKPLGLILYKGPSQIDGRMIVAIATFKSSNDKTGKMVQVWIMCADVDPILAIKEGRDYSVCGDCKHKHIGSCYVNIAFGPDNTFKAYIKDKYVPYDDSHASMFEGRELRLGAYGDPAAVPIEVWDKFTALSDGHTGYTHQWNTRKVHPRLKNYCMASCDNTTEYRKAKDLGWKCFRIRMSDDFNVATDRLGYNEFVCPASNEAGRKTSCNKCRACMGLEAKTKKDPVIIIHGLDHKIEKFKWGMERIAWKEKYRKVFNYPKPKKKKRKKRKSPEVIILEPMLV